MRLFLWCFILKLHIRRWEDLLFRMHRRKAISLHHRSGSSYPYIYRSIGNIRKDETVYFEIMIVFHYSTVLATSDICIVFILLFQTIYKAFQSDNHYHIKYGKHNRIHLYTTQFAYETDHRRCQHNANVSKCYL